ncbi:MAG: peptidoglycan recognition protein family protein [Phycisphaerae bacterium]|nr:peptidoglycan recognition protein family protein [Phycisphaerae bacterium]
MRIYDVVAIFAAVLMVGALGFAVGCEPLTMQWHNSRPDIAMPFVEMDFAAPKPVARRTVLRPVKEPAAIRLSTNHPWAAKGNRTWRHIVIHHSATAGGSAALFDKQHRDRGWDELGYHFVIGNGRGSGNGVIQVGSRWKKQKWGAHCGGTPGNEYNEHGVGICLVGNFMNRMPSSAQMAAMEKLVRYLMETYDIPADKVIAHKDAPNANTQCCGRVLHRHLRCSLKPRLRNEYASR